MNHLKAATFYRALRIHRNTDDHALVGRLRICRGQAAILQLRLRQAIFRGERHLSGGPAVSRRAVLLPANPKIHPGICARAFTGVPCLMPGRNRHFPTASTALSSTARTPAI